MAGVEFQKGSPEWYMFKDYWRLCQKFWFPEDGEDYWDMVNREISGFMKKHEDVLMSRELALVLNDFLDHRWRHGSGVKT